MFGGTTRRRVALMGNCGMAAPPATLQQLVVLHAEESRPRIRQLLGRRSRRWPARNSTAAKVAANGSERTEDDPRATEAIPDRGETSAGLTTCLACQVAQPPEEYSPGHSRCKACRRIEERDRARRKRVAAQASDSPG
jgi:hypothetical protein